MALSKLLAFRKPKQLELEEYLQKLKDKGLNPDGTPKLDPTPMAPPIGYKKHPSMVEIVRDMVRSEKLAQAAAATGHETFEEAEDFDIPDDPVQMNSPYENDFDPPLSELVKAGEEEVKKRPKKPADEPKPADKDSPPDPPADGPKPPKTPA